MVKAVKILVALLAFLATASRIEAGNGNLRSSVEVNQEAGLALADPEGHDHRQLSISITITL